MVVNDTPNTAIPRPRITKNLNRLLLFLAFIALSLAMVSTYFFTSRQVMEQANNELSLLVDMVKSARAVVREDTRPHFLPKGEFFPPVVSSTVMAKTVASKFKRFRPEYYIAIVSDNPLNKENLPDMAEKKILERFRQTKELENLREVGMIKDQQFLLSSAPAVAKEGCMRCHGAAASAPEAITAAYGTDSGFNWAVGDIVGASIVGVPLASVNQLVFKRSMYIIGFLALIFGLIFLSINRLIKQSIVKPLVSISHTAQDISQGNIHQSIEMVRDDEVGDLARSFELMRRSLVGLIRRQAGESVVEER